MIDEIFDLCLFGLLDGILIGIGSHFGGRGPRCFLGEVCGGNNAVGNLDFGNVHFFLPEASLEGEIEFALLHGFHIGEGVSHRVVPAESVTYLLIVVHHFFALEGGSLSDGFASLVAKHGGDCDDSFFLHILFGEASVDGHGHLTAYHLHRRGSHGEVVCGQFTKFSTRS